MIGFKDGVWQLRHKTDFKSFLGVRSHDRDTGKINKIALNFDKSALVNTSDDGTIFVYKLDYAAFHRISKGELIEVIWLL